MVTFNIFNLQITNNIVLFFSFYFLVAASLVPLLTMSFIMPLTNAMSWMLSLDALSS